MSTSGRLHLGHTARTGREKTNLHAPSGSSGLPVLSCVSAVVEALGDHGAAVLVAPPGTGKTTGIPPALAELAPGRGHPGRTVVVVPRRMAARAAAARMAANAGEAVGRRFGYSVRDDRSVSRDTVVEAVTPGLLLRRIQSDPALSGIATVIMDEFHERSIDQDLLLALLLDSRSALRDDLELLVMSATLEVEPLAGLLGADGASVRSGVAAPVIEVTSPLHPVQTFWRPGSVHDRISNRVADVVVEALNAHHGDVLVFLPGRGEIGATARLLTERLGPARGGPAHGGPAHGGPAHGGPAHGGPAHGGPAHGSAGDDLDRNPAAHATTVLELHGSLPPAAQDAVLAPAPPGVRRVILSTAIAETSVTVPGVRIVVDSGQRRYQAVDPGNGLPSLRTGAVSIATADQRRGRAGREAPGYCYRLWGRNDEELMRAHDPPEIAVGELTGLVLTTTTWGASSPQELSWLDPPPAEALAQATTLLGELGALDRDGRPTKLARRMTAFGYHPRTAAIAIAAVDRGQRDLAASTLAVLDDPPRDTADLVAAVFGSASGAGPRGRADGRAMKRWSERLGAIERGTGEPGATAALAGSEEAEALLGQIVLAGYADRIAKRRPDRDDTYLMRHGREVTASRGGQNLRSAEWLVVLDLDARAGSGGAGRIHLAAPLHDDAVAALLADAEASGGIRVEVEHSWDPADGSVATTAIRRLGAITVDSRRRRSAPIDGLVDAVTAVVDSQGPSVFNRWGSLDGLRSRVAFVAAHGTPRPGASRRARNGEAADPPDDGWPDLSESAVTSSCADWVPVLVASAARFGPHGEVTAFSPDAAMLEAALLTDLGHHDRVALDRGAPARWHHPDGAGFRLRYGAIDGDPASVLLAVRLQELIGVDEHPTAGAVPVTVELLSPAGRPLQRTLDLPGFWRGSYAQVRAEMRGRYPRHNWPERPWEP